MKQIQEVAQQLRTQISKVIVGQEAAIDQMLVALFAGGHVLLQGVPGVAKTLSAKTLAYLIKSSFKRIQFTPDLMPSDIIGTRVFDLSKSQFYTQKGPIFANIILADEINRAPSKTQSALLEAMEERQVTIEGETFTFEEPFMILATQNPIEFEGTYGLPEAQLDRFMLKILIEYPQEQDELTILKRYNEGFTASKFAHYYQLEPILEPEQIVSMRETIQQIKVHEGILQYINQIVRSTRNNQNLFMGSSPRGGIALLLTSKTYAALQGRDYVTPDDVKQMALPVLRHRIILRPEAEIDGLKPDEVLQEIIQNTQVPR
ncbi:MAG: MoxR family ATPase [Bacteroidia bacterium]|nr:MoxR family ATPase [Bacteroidia bacterium]MDW8301934.1 MoxR family ATPase [Bacteroidia bacterium]